MAALLSPLDPARDILPYPGAHIKSFLHLSGAKVFLDKRAKAAILESMVKIKTYKLSKRGARGLVLSMPKVWADDMKLKPGSRIDMYRDEQGQLILKVAGK